MIVHSLILTQVSSYALPRERSDLIGQSGTARFLQYNGTNMGIRVIPTIRRRDSFLFVFFLQMEHSIAQVLISRMNDYDISNDGWG